QPGTGIHGMAAGLEPFFSTEDTERGEEEPDAVHGEVVDGSWIMVHSILPLTMNYEPSAMNYLQKKPTVCILLHR
ncbi:MAG TPA: hypothetical protein PLY26_11615, partial [Ferruginibacter sp.]|nr:hypothetical protein [Ferruginibacter sp.]